MDLQPFALVLSNPRAYRRDNIYALCSTSSESSTRTVRVSCRLHLPSLDASLNVSSSLLGLTVRTNLAPPTTMAQHLQLAQVLSHSQADILQPHSQITVKLIILTIPPLLKATHHSRQYIMWCMVLLYFITPQASPLMVQKHAVATRIVKCITETHKPP